MKALVLEQYDQFACRDVPTPAPGPEEVLVAVKACGICGSDVHGMDGSTGRRRPPLIMGHEAAGVIVQTGCGVSAWRVGDRVTFDSTVYCGRCSFCRRGRVNLCDNRQVLGVSCEEYRRDGAFAEFVAVPQHVLYRLPDALSFESAAMAEALSIALHAVSRAPVTLNSTAVVVGAGMIGLLVIQFLRLAGCGSLIAVDIDADKLGLACALGADEGLLAGDAVLTRIMTLTQGHGVDHAFEVAGIAPTVRLAVDATRKGGTLTLVGNLAPTVELPLQAVVTREVTLYGSCASAGEYPTCLELLARRAIDVGPLISAVAPLDEGVGWFQRLYHKEKGLMKVILTP